MRGGGDGGGEGWKGEFRDVERGRGIERRDAGWKEESGRLERREKERGAEGWRGGEEKVGGERRGEERRRMEGRGEKVKAERKEMWLLGIMD